jgi:hypothetical protein
MAATVGNLSKRGLWGHGGVAGDFYASGYNRLALLNKENRIRSTD